MEIIKEQSRGLRGDLAAQLASEEPSFDQTGYQLLKFHGTYQQDDRDQGGAGTEKEAAATSSW